LLSLPAAGLGIYFLIARRALDKSRDRARLDRQSLKLLLQPLIAFATFVVVYPYLWVSPIRHTYNLFKFRVDEMEAQGSLNDSNRVDNSWIALDRIGNRIGEQWQTSAGPISALNERFDLTLNPFGLDPMLALMGMVVLTILVLRHGIRSSHALVMLLVLAESGAIVLGLRSDLYRYQLPLVLVETICISALVGVIWRSLASFDSFRWVREYVILPPDAGWVGADPIDGPAVPNSPRSRARRTRSSAALRQDGVQSPSWIT
jgi:hypothetical protein